MERIEREIAAGRVAIPVMFRRTPQLQEEAVSFEEDKSVSSGDCSDNLSDYSGYQSSEAEWEASIDSKGELIYIDCQPTLTKKTEDFNLQRTKSRRSTRGKLIRLIRRRESKRKLKLPAVQSPQKKLTGQTSVDSFGGGSNKVTFRDCQEGEEREVSLIVDPKNRIKYGRQVTINEAVLGLTLSSFSDGNRIMVAGIVPDSEAVKHRNIKIGDWLKSINDREVNTKNVTNVLERIKNPCIVRLKLQRIAGVEVTTEPPPNKIPKQSEFVRQLINPSVDDDHEITEILCKLPVGVLFLTTEGLSETGPEFQGVYYCYPGPLKDNVICQSRGAFITLHHLLPDILKSKVLSTSILLNDKLTHVIYSSEENEIFLLALPDNRCSLREAITINHDLVETLKFMYQTLNSCFSTDENLRQMDHFFARFFARLLSSGLKTDSPQSVEIQEIAAKAGLIAPSQFEEILRVAQRIPLPRDVQLDIDDMLNSLEACDYREWNEDPMDCQRLYTIIGSCVYHAGYLLGSHFTNTDLIDVHSFCRQQGLLHLFRTESVRSFVLWREVFPSSCNRGLSDKPPVTGGYQLPKGRWFLLIVGYNQDMLAVIFEAGGCTVPAEGQPGPDPFYVEEVQFTLQDLQSFEVMDIAQKWIAANIYPQIVVEIGHKNKRGSFGKAKTSDNSPSFIKTSPSTFGRKTEVTSILKRRSSSDLHSSQLYSSSPIFPPSGDVSDESRSFRSVNSDEQQPVIGRREARERGMPIGDDSESESEWNASRGTSQSSSSFDLSDVRHALLSEIDNTPPYKITAGNENVLFHYVKLDAAEGIMLCPVVDSRYCPDRYRAVLDNFRRCSQIIHHLFLRTIRYKKLLNHNTTEKPIINKSLVAIKEHGVLFECPTLEIETGKKNKNLPKYWVIGRLFSEPSQRELYVCHEESIPQNMVEIAFRLGILEAG